MIVSEKIEALVEGGKASAGPPLGPALGPMGVNIGEVIKQINEKTKDFSGMKVPVTVIIDGKDFKIKVGTPPVSAMIKKEAKVEKLSSHPKEEKVADLKIEQIIKVAKNKKDTMNSVDMKSCVRQVIGTCTSCGILVEGKDPREVLKEIDEGKYDEEIRTEKTELTEEELKELEEERKELAEERKKHEEDMRNKAEEIMKKMEGQERKEIVTKMHDEEISQEIIDEFLPREAEAKDAKVTESGKKTEAKK